MDNKFYENIRKCLDTEWEESIDESYGNMWSPSDSSVANAIEELVNAPKTQDILDKAKLVAEYVDKHLKHNLSVVDIDERVFAGKVILDDLIEKINVEVDKEKKKKEDKKTTIFGVGFIVVLGLLILTFALGSGKISFHKYTYVRVTQVNIVYNKSTKELEGYVDVCNDTRDDIDGVKIVVDTIDTNGDPKMCTTDGYDIKIKSRESQRIYIDEHLPSHTAKCSIDYVLPY